MPIVDFSFPARGDPIPADHGYLLFSSLCHLIDSLHSDRKVQIHTISGHSIGQRQLALHRTSAITIRCDSDRLGELLPLAGKSLNAFKSRVTLGVPRIHVLKPAQVLTSRLVVIKGFLDPDPFLEAAQRQLTERDINGLIALRPRHKTLPPRDGGQGSRSPWLRRTLSIKQKVIVGFAVEVSKLSQAGSIRLQELGLGGRQRFGCGIFTASRAPGDGT